MIKYITLTLLLTFCVPAFAADTWKKTVENGEDVWEVSRTVVVKKFTRDLLVQERDDIGEEIADLTVRYNEVDDDIKYIDAQ